MFCSSVTKKCENAPSFPFLPVRNTLLWREVYIRQILSIFGAQTPFQNTNRWILVIFLSTASCIHKTEQSAGKNAFENFLFCAFGRAGAAYGNSFFLPSPLSPASFGTQTLWCFRRYTVQCPHIWSPLLLSIVNSSSLCDGLFFLKRRTIFGFFWGGGSLKKSP